MLAVARMLARTVFVTDPDTRRRVMFVGGSVPPPWAAKLITNKRAWGAEVPEPEPDTEPEQTEPVAPPIDSNPEAEVGPDTEAATADHFGRSPLDTIDELAAWIGDDPLRAAQVLAYETDSDDPRPRSGRNRKGVLAAVSAILGDD